MATTDLCQAGGMFRRCKQLTSHTCQYCGNAFCGEHGRLLEDNQEVCQRPRCQRKLADVEAHLRYKERVRQRNYAGSCGVEECLTQYSYQCSLCRGVFCIKHISQRVWTTRTPRSVETRSVAACPHCWDRRKIWSRV